MTNVKLIRKPFAGSFNSFVDDFFSDLPVLFKDVNINETKGFVPVNVKETDKSYQVEVVAPGFEKTDFKLNIEHDLLTIEADKKNDPDRNREKEGNEKHIRREYSYHSFKRSFTLDEKIDATNIEASYINGVLTLNLPKKTDVKIPATKIEIK